MIHFLSVYQAEHDQILGKRRSLDSSFVTWEEYKSMTFTLQVSFNNALLLIDHFAS